MAIKAEFHTNESTKLRDDNIQENGTNSNKYDASTNGKGNYGEVKQLNQQEKSRLQELYDASRSLSCPLEQEKDVSQRILTNKFTKNLLLSMTILKYSAIKFL